MILRKTNRTNVGHTHTAYTSDPYVNVMLFKWLRMVTY